MNVNVCHDSTTQFYSRYDVCVSVCVLNYIKNYLSS